MSLKLEVGKRKALKKLSNYSNVVLINSSLILEKNYALAFEMPLISSSHLLTRHSQNEILLCSRLRDAFEMRSRCYSSCDFIFLPSRL